MSDLANQTIAREVHVQPTKGMGKAPILRMSEAFLLGFVLISLALAHRWFG